MKKTIIGVLIVIAALAVGVGGAYLVVRSLPTADDIRLTPRNLQPNFPQDRDDLPFGRQGNSKQFQPMTPGGGMMGRDDARGWFFGANPEGDRISMDGALANAQEYIADKGDNLRVAEIMEFSNNFYAVVVESDTGKGAFELLIQPVTGEVALEPGPNMMWNAKYGHMASADPAKTNAITMQEAAADAQKALDQRNAGATVSKTGYDFYGYYTFDYEINGKVAGMLSVNGETGNVWFHTWHGDFISEKEID